MAHEQTLRGFAVTGIHAIKGPSGLRRVNVAADGDCGAHVLAIVYFGVTGKTVNAKSVRQALYDLASRETRLLLSHKLYVEFCRSFDTVAKSAFLNHTEMNMFAHALRLNVCIVSSSRLTQFQCPKKAKGWIFLLFTGGNHWQLLAQYFDKRIHIVWTHAEADKLLAAFSRKGTEAVHGSSPIKEYAAFAGPTPLFKLDFQDRLWKTASPSVLV